MSFCKLKYKDENGKDVDNSEFEKPEQYLADIYISRDATVLEMGARYGTVSCIINKRLKDPTKQVSVEPDERVLKALEKNKKRNKCEFNILYGTISKKPVKLTGLDVYYGYGTTGEEDETSSIPHYSVAEVEKKYNLKFDTLVADCEGCLEVFFDDNKDFIKKLKLVFIEKDYPEKTNYRKVTNFLKKNNFDRIVGGQNLQHEIWKKPDARSVSIGGRRKTKRRKH
jgi:FkbM family methyltransferase